MSTHVLLKLTKKQENILTDQFSSGSDVQSLFSFSSLEIYCQFWPLNVTLNECLVIFFSSKYYHNQTFLVFDIIKQDPKQRSTSLVIMLGAFNNYKGMWSRMCLFLFKLRVKIVKETLVSEGFLNSIQFGLKLSASTHQSGLLDFVTPLSQNLP